MQGGTPYEVEYDAMMKAFEKAYPNVKVIFKDQTFTQETKTGVLELSGSNVPAVFQANEGWDSLGLLVKDGLLVPLDGYAAKYHWAKYQSAPLMSVDGRQTATVMGQGPLYGMATEGEWVGVYYNKALLKKIGRPVPQTLTAFEQDMKIAKAAGITPMALATGGSPCGLNEYWWFLTWLSETPTSALAPIRDVIDAAGHYSWSTPGSVKAAATVLSWTKAGYFNSDYAGLTYPGGPVSLFTSGKTLFYLDGNWDVPSIVKGMGNNVGLFPFPAAVPGRAPQALAIGGTPWVIPARGPDHALAAEFINFIVSPAVARLILKQGGQLPATTFPGELQFGKSLGAVLDDQVDFYYKEVLAGTAEMPDPDWATPDMFGDIDSGMQSLMAGRTSPQEYVGGLQSDETSFRATLASG
jgi:raffinose/stachyose/melibiose transport system substrate-binding protein